MTVRSFLPNDVPQVNALHRAVWWPERTAEGWAWLRANPARQGDEPIGWIVDDKQGQVAAFAGNFVQDFWMGERRLRAAQGFSIIVTRGARGASRTLIPTVLNQPDVDWVFTLNANPVSQPLYGRHGMTPPPGADHRLKLSWPTARSALGQAWLLRRAARYTRIKGKTFGERLMNRRLDRLAYADLPEGVAPLTDLRDQSAYGDFWQALKAEGRLMADRSPATLRWRLADPDQVRAPVLLACWSGGRIVGVAMAMTGKMDGLAAPVLEVIDLEALEGEPQAVPALMTALRGMARPMGAAKVRLQVVSPRQAARLGDHLGEARHEGGWGHAFARFAPEMETAAARWEPTPFDGDYGFCLRPAPVAAPRRWIQSSPSEATILVRGDRRRWVRPASSFDETSAAAAGAGATERVRKPGSAVPASA